MRRRGKEGVRGASTSGWHVRSTVEWAIDFFFCTALYCLCRLRFLFGLAADSLLYNAVRCALHCVVGVFRLRFVCGLFANSVCFCTNAAQEMRCKGLIFHARSPCASHHCLVVFSACASSVAYLQTLFVSAQMLHRRCKGLIFRARSPRASQHT